MSDDGLRQRLGAILAADVVGYSRLMADDDRATVIALDTARAVFRSNIEQHRGRLIDMAGDSVLAVFETAMGAVKAALVIQQEINRLADGSAENRQMRFRIGIHVGDIIEKSDGTIYGDGVNIASRIEGLTVAGGIGLSDAVHGAVRGRFAQAFSDEGEKSVKNIPYPVRMFSIELEDSAPSLPPKNFTSLPAPDESSIAVLPFKVLSDDRQIELLADGLAEDVTALLARVAGFVLISQSSTRGLGQSTRNTKETARQLDVRYIVQSSVRPTSNGIRVSTQLIDAMSGALLWSGRFDSNPSNVDDLQDAIARGIISELEPELTRAEIALIKRQRPENIDAWGCYRQAVGAIASKGWTEQTLLEVRTQFQRALIIDPDFCLARANLALMTAAGMQIGLVPYSAALAEEARKFAEDSISEDFGSAEVLGYAGCALSDLGYHDRGTEVLTRALEIDPSNAQAHVAYGAICSLQGQFEIGIERMRYGIRISPRDRRLGFWTWALGNFLLRAGKFDDALVEARTSARRDATLYLARVLECAALLALRQEGDARQALVAARKTRPTLTLDEIARTHGRDTAGAMKPLW